MPILRRTQALQFRRFSTGAPTSPVIVGLRREDRKRIWERRTPLTPSGVRELIQSTGARVLVQNCDRRVFPMNDFILAGAEEDETLEAAHIVLGIKETPLSELYTSKVPSTIPGRPDVPRTHLMFSHTTKGQTYNMPLLSRFTRSRARLIDYEQLTQGPECKRSVGFGWFAGVSGVLESLSAMAQRHLEFGVASPFLNTPRPHTHPNMQSLCDTLRKVVGSRIAQEGTPEALGPCIICYTGTGQVAIGVRAMLNVLPVTEVQVKDLAGLVSDPATDLSRVYILHAQLGDYLSKEDGSFDRGDYNKNPSSYKSEFHTKIAPYLTLFINGVGWQPTFPRLMSNEQLDIATELAHKVGRGRFASVGDISCDIAGGLEFLTNSTTVDAPFFDVHTPSGPVQIMAVDILPSSLPLDASAHFSKVLMPYLTTLIGEYNSAKPTDPELKDAMDRATIVRNGKLTEKHAWLAAEVAKVPKDDVPATTQKVLMLGSGMVAGPAVSELCKRENVQVIVVSNSAAEVKVLTAKHENATVVVMDMNDHKKLSSLVKGADIVISLLPVPFHPAVAELCIEHGKNLVTASYISPAMKALHQRAVDADVLLLNEIGLDPGIDHCSAIELLERLRAEKKRVVSFTSFCGGLPAPECADVPLGYRFSWSPRGVLGAALNGAVFKLNGVNWDIPGSDIMKTHFPKVPISNVLKLEGIANRDSLPYAETYGLGPVGELRTLLRGTLRYPGFCELVHAFKAIGLLSVDKPFQLDGWSSFTRQSLETTLGTRIPEDEASVLSALGEVVHASELPSVVKTLEWLSILGPSADSFPAIPKTPTAAIDLFTTILAYKLRYEPEQRDLVILSHEIVAVPLDASPGAKEEVHTSSLITYGTAEASAMARSVGLPVAFAALEVLAGGASTKGVQGPTEKSVYKRVLSGLEEVGLGMKEGVTNKSSMEALLDRGLSRH